MDAIGHCHHRFEAAEVAVGAPVFGEIDASAFKLVGEAFELGFKAFEQGKSIGRGTGETGEDGTVADAADLARVAFDDGVAEADLAITGHGNRTVCTDAENGRAVPADRVVRVFHQGEMALAGG
jgi:hypothetical protein